jgi:Protein of unknown function (DUF4238)
MSEYRHNHYVPVWYQKRFMRPGQARYHRLDLAPDEVIQGTVKYRRKDWHYWSPEKVFAQTDLYTTQWGAISNTEIEQFFFGQLDAAAAKALDYFTSFTHPSVDGEAFNTLLRYMSVQKLRTPKGLAELAARSNSPHPNLTLLLLQDVQTLYGAIWTEAVWQIANASGSPTKFIISDHPVTVYNRACPPLSQWCVGYHDPDIRMNASHTYFPLSLDRVLILTNLSWARDPYQNEKTLRPNPDFLRPAIFNFEHIQTERLLSEDEVLQINSITKRRAYRYIAAAEPEWLYPERYLSTDHWRKLGDGYLLMPEPRLLHMGGEIFIGYDDGGKDAFGPYGHKPWQRGFKDAKREQRESEALERFQAEWALKHGPKYTAHDYAFGGRIRDSDEEMMAHYAEVRKKYRRR